ncbi:MAG: NAD(P)-binding domain-containing protein [Cyanobacteria bacterium P01_D01_bin.105]
MANIHAPSPLPENFATKDFWELPPLLPESEMRLHKLTAALYADLDIVSYPGRQWDYSRDPGVLEVAIVGGGQVGRSVAFGLRQHGIARVRIFDQRTVGQEGVWRTFARNATLRSPKKITGGLHWGIPNLSFRRWCEALYGEAYWQRIQYIPRLLWADYLDWYGKVLDLPMQNETSIEDVSWCAAQQCFVLQARHHGKAETYRARFVIFATGMEGGGGKNLPRVVSNNLPAHCYHHTMDAIDFTAYAGKRVVVVGGGASAFDNALLLLRAGAQQVDMVLRRSRLPNLNRIRWSEWNGYHRHYIDLSDTEKWAYSLSEMRLGQLPPAHTYHQTVNHKNFTLYTSAPIEEIEWQGKEIVGRYGGRVLRHDALICGTGFANSLDKQIGLQTLAPHIARWKDCFTPPPDDEHAEMGQYPYLGKSLEFIPKSAEHHYLRRCYYPACGSAMLSAYRANLTDLQFMLPRIAYDIGRQLFIEHQNDIRADFEAYDQFEY